MSMKSNNLLSILPQQLHVALDDNQLLHLFRVQGGPLGVTSQLWLHCGLQTSGHMPGQAWASRVGDIRPPSCNRSQSPIWCHLQLGLHWACDRSKHIQHGAACGYYLLFSGEQWAFGICPTLTHCHPWSSWKHQKLPTAVCDSCMCIVYRTDPQCCCSRLWPLILIVYWSSHFFTQPIKILSIMPVYVDFEPFDTL